MANPFLNNTTLVDRDIDTALLLEQAHVLDIGNAVAYTDGDRVFINTDDNLFNILPAYDQRMLKWLLWHEKMHMELRHHNRFFRYLKELNAKETKEKFNVTKDEVNIIMDIIVHDWMSEKFPELIETAIANLAQMRNRNSLKYTFKTHTLEEMLKEYAEFKSEDDTSPKDPPADETTDEPTDEPTDDEPTDEPTDKTITKTHGKSKDEPTENKDKKDKPEDTPPEIKDGEQPPEPEHDKTDWSKLDNIDSKEFITASEGDKYEEVIQQLKRKKFRLGKLTETLNGLVTSTRKRSYAMPSTIFTGGGIMLKGSTPRTY